MQQVGTGAVAVQGGRGTPILAGLTEGVAGMTYCEDCDEAMAALRVSLFSSLPRYGDQTSRAVAVEVLVLWLEQERKSK